MSYICINLRKVSDFPRNNFIFESRDRIMANFTSAVAAISIIVGIVIIVKPDFLALLVGLYLVISGIVSLINK